MLASAPPSSSFRSRLGYSTGLTRTDIGARGYIWRGWLWALIPSLVVAGLLSAVGLLEDTPGNDMLQEMDPVQVIIMALIGAPLLETLVLAVILGLLGWKWPHLSRTRLAAISAVLWGLFHFGNGPTIPLVIAWPFFVFSMAFLVWRPHGWLRAYAICAAIHFLQNVLPVIAILLT